MSEVRNLDAVGFKYKIGDRLMHIGHQALGFDPSRPEYFPACFVVQERIAQECPGGVQLKYGGTWAVACGTAGGGPPILLESDLARYVPPKSFASFTAEEAVQILQSVIDNNKAKG